MNRRMFFALLGAPLVAKNQLTKVVPKKWPPPSIVYYDEGLKCAKVWTYTWKYKTIDLPSQVG